MIRDNEAVIKWEMITEFIMVSGGAPNIDLLLSLILLEEF
jgi:hypothetical protein